ncbi:glycosyltransferase family 4 protein [Desulfopila sp. IMCC35006]|uniref:glycosyltransferase family 4 protein n=1 Tax=Desulfopila sp. IMCC35006 TaxID=2569542 RepID=UPI0010ABDBFB|nr:glycosyltransferase family 1 protein [Desulfopila sp. IMCC35006]TKB26455.1 glycosyltransferase family 4 protein [Desulfopila sp. IMCC35006]
MHIAYDYQIFTLQEYGGISRYFFELADKIARVPGSEVCIISPLYVNAHLTASSSFLQVIGRKVPKIRYAVCICRAVNQLLTPLMMARLQPDLVHETYYSARRVAPVGGKVVLTVFDMIHERFPEFFLAGDSTSKEKAIAIGRADHIICISEQTRKDLVALLNVDPAKITVVHLGFSLPELPVDEGRRTGRPYLLYVGSRDGYKNFEALLHVYAANLSLQRDYDLVAFGGGAFTEQEQALMGHLGIGLDQVRHFCGGDSLLAGLYQQAALFVYPSLYEGFGIPPLEAMSFDCPVVCSNASSIPEVVGDAAELFDPNSSEALWGSIERVLNDEVLRQTLVVRGRERIKQFSWENCADQTLDVYRRLLS